MKFIISFTKGIELVYDLIDHEIIPEWKELISLHPVNDCCPNNHYVGLSSYDLVNQKIARLYELCDLINIVVPDRAIKRDITLTDWQSSLSVMHTHFPELKNDSAYQGIWGYLTEYNDIIHWLESTLPNIDDSSLFRITLDFNKSGTRFLTIPESAYSLFSPNVCFGELLLHYTHVGKNAYELFVTKDFDCPPDQFVPQRTFSASVRMHFTNNFLFPYESWTKFYEDRGGKEFWRYDIDDPQLALGFMKIGQLTKITVEQENYPIPSSIEEMNSFRRMLYSASITEYRVE